MPGKRTQQRRKAKAAAARSAEESAVHPAPPDAEEVRPTVGGAGEDVASTAHGPERIEARAAAGMAAADSAARPAGAADEAGAEALRTGVGWREAAGVIGRLLKLTRVCGKSRTSVAAYSGMGIAHRTLGERSKAVECFERQLVVALAHGDTVNQGDAYIGLGDSYTRLGDPTTAIEYLKRSLSIMVSERNADGEGRTWGCMGNAFETLGQLEQALACHRKHLEIAQATGDLAGQGAAHGGMGHIAARTEKWPFAIECHERQLGIARSLGNVDGMGKACHSLGRDHEALGNHAEAAAYYGQQLTHALRTEDPEAMALANEGMGSVHLTLGREDEAIACFGRALSWASGNIGLEGPVLSNMAVACTHAVAVHYRDGAGSSSSAAAGLGTQVGAATRPAAVEATPAAGAPGARAASAVDPAGLAAAARRLKRYAAADKASSDGGGDGGGGSGDGRGASLQEATRALLSGAVAAASTAIDAYEDLRHAAGGGTAREHDDRRTSVHEEHTKAYDVLTSALLMCARHGVAVDGLSDADVARATGRATVTSSATASAALFAGDARDVAALATADAARARSSMDALYAAGGAGGAATGGAGSAGAVDGDRVAAMLDRLQLSLGELPANTWVVEFASEQVCGYCRVGAWAVEVTDGTAGSAGAGAAAPGVVRPPVARRRCRVVPVPVGVGSAAAPPPEEVDARDKGSDGMGRTKSGATGGEAEGAADDTHGGSLSASKGARPQPQQLGAQVAALVAEVLADPDTRGGATGAEAGAHGDKGPSEGKLDPVTGSEEAQSKLCAMFVRPMADALLGMAATDADDGEPPPAMHLLIVPSHQLHMVPWAALLARPGFEALWARLASIRVAASIELAAHVATRADAAPPDTDADTAGAATAVVAGVERDGIHDSLVYVRDELQLLPWLLRQCGVEATATLNPTKARMRAMLLGGEAGAPAAGGAGSRPGGSVGSAAAGNAVLHVSCHGVHEPANGLVMAPDPAAAAAAVADTDLLATAPADGVPSAQLLGYEEVRVAWRDGVFARPPRLAVLSACVTQVGKLSAEGVLALPRVFLLAGTESVVATLENVDETATAVLLTRLYVELLGPRLPSAKVRAALGVGRDATRDSDHVDAAAAVGDTDIGEQLWSRGDVPAALLRAQRWLRGATVAEVCGMMSVLEDAAWEDGVRLDVLAPRHLELELLPDDVTKAVRRRQAAVVRPFAEPRFWAPYVAIGC